MSIYGRRPERTERSEITRIYWKLMVKITTSASLLGALAGIAMHSEFVLLAAVTFSATAFAAHLLFVSRMPLVLRLAILVAGCLLINHWVDQPHSAYQLMADFARFLSNHHLGKCIAKAPDC